MTSKNYIYPITSIAFKNWYMINPKWEYIYNSLKRPRPFDVSLRDGLQSLSENEKNQFNLEKKINLYNEIVFNYKPKGIEIGSIVSNKLLPIFKDTLDLANYVDNQKKNNDVLVDIDNYILIPNNEKLKTTIDNENIKNICFITSVSNSFQFKNTKMNTIMYDNELKVMLKTIKTNNKPINNMKLYVSCINECPIEGKISNDFIIVKLIKYFKLGITNICLSDTCGTLIPQDFEYIVDSCNNHGLTYNNFSLHLHVKPGRESIVEQIIHKALDRKIIDFDVSVLETGGCIITMDKSQINPNLSYELYFKSLCSYIEKKSNEI